MTIYIGNKKLTPKQAAQHAYRTHVADFEVDEDLFDKCTPGDLSKINEQMEKLHVRVTKVLGG